ncbi:hypothetical protein H4W29_005515 [Rhizobium viscosum]|uniref:Uncharacterized protein n=1 Tax=Rhizobium viscosum TaxID=1673 RepID=A0ABR9IYW4_RHIVS|nr:hypothetical protein [Rhizobium viscosum]
MLEVGISDFIALSVMGIHGDLPCVFEMLSGLHHISPLVIDPHLGDGLAPTPGRFDTAIASASISAGTLAARGALLPATRP